MLKKLLRYDFKAVLKYWWIAALSSVVLSFGGGWCISVFSNEKALPEALYVVAGLLMVIVVLGFAAFSILSTILTFSRFYKNFFTDEGYLTFTLPVKRSQLLNSKLIVSTTTTLLTTLVIIIDVLIMVCVGFYKDIFTGDFRTEIPADSIINVEYIGYYFLYFIEALALVVLLVVFSTLFMFSCITVASIIAKKAKVITAIGIYYVANSAFSFIVQMFWVFGMVSIDSWLSRLTTDNSAGMIALILFGLILFMSIFCGVLYSLQYWMLDRKLNLS